MKKLLIIFGSTRPSRQGLPVGKWICEVALQSGLFEVSFADLKDINLPLLDEPDHPAKQNYTKEHTRHWSAMVDAADAFIFVTPEYDYFPPAALVNAIQFLSREWSKKPAGIVSYGGVSGGLRSAQALRLLLSGVNVMALSLSVSLPFFAQFINAENKLEPDDRLEKGAISLLKALHEYFAEKGSSA
jgi:NAD(P)H-dependent FMN reductase